MTSLIQLSLTFEKVKVFCFMANGIPFTLCLAVFYEDCPYSFIPWAIFCFFSSLLLHGSPREFELFPQFERVA